MTTRTSSIRPRVPLLPPGGRGAGGAGSRVGRDASDLLAALCEELRAAHGPQHGWWPQTHGPFEVACGAILVQHTAWTSAARAIERLKAAGALDCPAALLALSDDALKELVRPTGTYRAKARTLRAFARAAKDRGGLDGLFAGTADEVRARLLAVRGVGPETADAITLYAAGLPTFVVDTYARRLLAARELFEVLGLPETSGYEAIRRALLATLPSDAAHLAEWHALVVEAGRGRA